VFELDMRRSREQPRGVEFHPTRWAA
jgi:hypothetical protein